MDRERIRDQVRRVLLDRMSGGTPPHGAPPGPLPAPPVPGTPGRRADLLSCRRFDDDRARRELVTEADVMRARAGAKVLSAPADAIVTPLARETAGRLGVRIEVAAARKTVALAADHGGFALKEALKPFVASLGFEVSDLGAKDASPVDYPDFAHPVADAVTSGRVAFGIVVDGVGVGSAMAVNRHPGARAAPCSTTMQAQSAREHNDANVLTLGGRHLGEDVAKAIVKAFLETPFAGGRHLPRVQKIEMTR
jgi:ribose 5-phosphate isomerase B